jgi:hypothetical protein
VRIPLLGGQERGGWLPAEKGELPSFDFVGQQALVVSSHVFLGLHLGPGGFAIRSLHIVENENVRVRRRRTLFESAVGQAENLLQPLYYLGQHPRVDLDLDSRRFRYHLR